jgi:ATP-dependent protease ClpP protease subunit
MANRWVAREHIDDNTCQPCIDNDGKLYKNREDAYADYPGGKGFVNCIGAEHGNDCRGKVVKRRGGRAMTPEQVAALENARKVTCHFSAKMFTNVEGPTEKLRVEPRAAAVTPASSNAKIYLYDYIGGYDGITAMDVVSALDGVTGDVDLHINSGGGSIFEGAAIYTAFDNYSGGLVKVRIDGVAASAASAIAMVGDEIEIAPAATMMLHAGSGGVWGTAKEARALADVLDMLTLTFAGVYAARAGGTPESWFELLNSGDTWYNAQSALDAKLATRIGGKPMPDEPMPDDEPTDVLDALYASFTKSQAMNGWLPTQSTSSDYEGIRNALKGMFA